jgi:hypothetical protein
MRRPARPLDPEAVKAANEAVWEKYPDLHGRQLTMEPQDGVARKAWMDAYLSALGAKKVPSPPKPEPPPVVQCPECRCDDKPTPIDPTTMCKSGCGYYSLREADFRARHTCPQCSAHNPPDYYLSYGLKYCVEFSTVTAPRLSPAGKAWLARARCNLQIMMEKGLMRSPALEKDSDTFRKFAFGTHAPAYLSAGLADLAQPSAESVKDIYYISKTADAKEWLKADTWKQAGEAGAGVAGEKLDKAAEAIKDWFGP